MTPEFDLVDVAQQTLFLRQNLERKKIGINTDRSRVDLIYTSFEKSFGDEARPEVCCKTDETFVNRIH